MSTLPPRLALLQYPEYELYRSFTDANAAHACYNDLIGQKQIIIQKKRKPWRMTAKRKKMFKNWKGHPQSLQTRQKIARSKQGQGLGVPKSRTHRLAIAVGLMKTYREVPRRRCVDQTGIEHLVPRSFVLHAGWCWGRPRGKGGGRPLGQRNLKGTARPSEERSFQTILPSWD